jgi:hypothetical protein
MNKAVRPGDSIDVPTGSFIRSGERAPSRRRRSWAFGRRQCLAEGLKEQALARIVLLGVKPRRYRPDDKRLAFLESL